VTLKKYKLNIPEGYYDNEDTKRWIQEDEERRDFEERKSFELVLPEGYVKNNTVIIDDITKQLKDPKGDRAFLFAGGVGCGKTYLSQIIADIVIPKKFRTGGNYIFTDSYKVWEQAKHCYTHYLNVNNEIMLAPYYILDDLGAEDNTEASRSFMHNHLLKVYNRWRHGGFKLLIVSMNIGFEDIRERYTDRVESRFYETFRLYRFTDRDFRKEKVRLVSSKKSSNKA
jgi:DNA replication protein DnaC